MTNNDEIEKLAREYVEQSAEEVGTKLDPESWAFDCMMSQTKDVINFLLRTHCIVSKEKVTELCRLTLEHEDSVDYGLIDGLTDVVCNIFSEQYHQVAEGLDNPEIAKESESEVISGWVARNNDNSLYLFKAEPWYNSPRGYWDEPMFSIGCFSMPSELFPQITFDNSPLEVDITIKPKKK